MKQLLCIFTLFFIVALRPSFAQVDEINFKLINEDFVYLKNGEIIKGKSVSLQDPLLKRKFILVDNIEFKAKEVRFYQNQFGFHANVSQLLGPLNFSTYFAPRIKAGKVNLYKLVRVSQSPTTFNQATGAWSGGGSSEEIDYFYNKGFEPVKKANYSNLSMDLKDNPLAMNELNKYRNKRLLSIGSYAGAGILLLAGALRVSNRRGISTSYTPQDIGIVVGVATLGIAGYVFNLSKQKHLENAIVKYNL